MPVYTSLTLACDICGKTQAADKFTDPVLACGEYGWEYYEPGKCYCENCQHELSPLAHVQPEASRYTPCAGADGDDA